MLGTKILETRKSKYNGVLRVVKTWGIGTYIQAEGLTQSGGIVETIWRTTLKNISHNKSLAKSELDKSLIINHCLILGLGGGTVAKLVRKYWPDAKIVGVDIDPVMVELGKKYLDLDKQNVQILISDASNPPNTPNLPKTYDLVVVDLYQGDKFPKVFGTKNYIQLVGSLLASRGTAIFNRLYYGDKKKEAAIAFGKKLEKVFNSVEVYYPITNVMFLCKK
jgi:spermidine synthase